MVICVFLILAYDLMFAGFHTTKRSENIIIKKVS